MKLSKEQYEKIISVRKHLIEFERDFIDYKNNLQLSQIISDYFNGYNNLKETKGEISKL